MSANQIPAPRPRRDRARHSCPRCWMNGGPGHTIAEQILMTRGVDPDAAEFVATITTTTGR